MKVYTKPVYCRYCGVRLNERLRDHYHITTGEKTTVVECAVYSHDRWYQSDHGDDEYWELILR